MRERRCRYARTAVPDRLAFMADARVAEAEVVTPPGASRDGVSPVASVGVVPSPGRAKRRAFAASGKRPSSLERLQSTLGSASARRSSRSRSSGGGGGGGGGEPSSLVATAWRNFDADVTSDPGGAFLTEDAPRAACCYRASNGVLCPPRAVPLVLSILAGSELASRDKNGEWWPCFGCWEAAWGGGSGVLVLRCGAVKHGFGTHDVFLAGLSDPYILVKACRPIGRPILARTCLVATLGEHDWFGHKLPTSRFVFFLCCALSRLVWAPRGVSYRGGLFVCGPQDVM